MSLVRPFRDLLYPSNPLFDTFTCTVLMWAWKVDPALGTGNTIVMKPSKLTPLTALMATNMLRKASIPPGVFNLIVGYGPTVGQAISKHHGIEKVAFTGSTLVGRKIMEAAARTNLKNVTLELGRKSLNIIFTSCNDADLDQAVNWVTHGVLRVSRRTVSIEINWTVV